MEQQMGGAVDASVTDLVLRQNLLQQVWQQHLALAMLSPAQTYAVFCLLFSSSSNIMFCGFSLRFMLSVKVTYVQIFSCWTRTDNITVTFKPRIPV